MTTLYDQLTFYIDPIGICFFGILMIALIVLLSTDFLRVRIRPRRRYYPPACHMCGKPWDGNHFCKDRHP